MSVILAWPIRNTQKRKNHGSSLRARTIAACFWALNYDVSMIIARLVSGSLEIFWWLWWKCSWTHLVSHHACEQIPLFFIFFAGFVIIEGLINEDHVLLLFSQVWLLADALLSRSISWISIKGGHTNAFGGGHAFLYLENCLSEPFKLIGPTTVKCANSSSLLQILHWINGAGV